MRRVQVLAVMLILVALGSSARAQSPDIWQTYSQLLASNPSAASALQADPSLYRSSAFMNQNPTLQSYILQHPDLYRSLMSRAPNYRPDSNAYALSSYLHYHPQVAQALDANPALSTDPGFLQHHPDFRAFLQRHPVVQRRLATRGWDFEQWQHYHSWNGRTEWRDADDWSDRDWRQRWEPRNEYREEEAEEEEHEEHHRHHHDNGKHIGWYKHHKHDGQDDEE